MMLLIVLPMIVLYYVVGLRGLATAFVNGQFLDSLGVTFIGATAATMLTYSWVPLLLMLYQERS